MNQFTEVQHTNWASQALQVFANYYGCIVSYPNQTFRSNHSVTRYEFAIELNDYVDRIDQMLASMTADLIEMQDS